MAFPQPPKYYPPVELDQASGRYELTEPWHDWFLRVARDFGLGYSGTVALAKITGGGADGSLTVVDGLVTAVTAPT